MEKTQSKTSFKPLFSEIQSGEMTTLIIIFIHSFLNGLALVYFETTASTLFLMEYSSSEIPLVYILSAATSVLFGYFFTKLESSVDVKKLLKLTLGFIFVSILLFFIVIKFNDNKLGYFGIMIFKDILWMFAGIEFGIITSIIFDIRQGKRLFGILVSGEIIAGIIGGISVGFLLEYIETVDLLLLSSCAMLISFGVLIRILQKFSNQFNESEEDQNTNASNSYKSLFKNKYYVSFFVVSVLSFLVFYFIDYIFYYSVEQNFQTEKELATFFGIFFSVLNGVNLISSLFISGKVLKNYGIGFGLLAIPVVAFLGTSSILVSASAVLGLSFILIVTLKILDEVLDISILTPSFKILYQAIPSNQRTKVLTFRETVIEPIAMGFAGLFLFLASYLDGIEIIYFLLIVLSAVWLYYGVLLKNGYVESLKKIINNRSDIPTDLIADYIDDKHFLEKVKSDNFIEVIYSLDYLHKSNYEELESLLLATLNYPHRSVKIKVLEIIGERGLYSFGDYLEFLLNSESDEEVLGVGIITYCKIDGGGAIDYIQPYLQSKSSYIREKTIVGLIKYCGIDGVMIAGGYLESVFNSGNVEEIQEAFKMLNEIGVPGFYKQIQKAIESDEKKIKIAAIKAVGNLQMIQFVELLISFLHDPLLKTHTTKALKKFGFSIFSLLRDEFQTSTNPIYREALISIMASMDNKYSNEFILESLNEDSIVFDAGIKELYNNGFKTKEKALVDELIEKNIEYFEIYSNYKFSLEGGEFLSSVGIIENEISTKIDNLFFILSFLYQKETLKKAFLNYKSKIKEKKVYAIELIDNLLNNDLKRKVTPIIEKQIAEKKEGELDLNRTIEEILSRGKYPIILLISLVYELAKKEDKQYVDVITQLASSEDIFLKETADWALEKLRDK